MERKAETGTVPLKLRCGRVPIPTARSGEELPVFKRGQVTADPARGRSALIVHAALHQFHGLEVTARFVRRAAGMDDRKMLGFARHRAKMPWMG